MGINTTYVEYLDMIIYLDRGAAVLYSKDILFVVPKIIQGIHDVDN
ncbi:hypothetical protein ACN6MY_21520 [Peribacillus sp. B-H-3]|jgi:hypothetical protein